MDAERLNKLSEGQRACLRMVFMHMSSKDIARELGISPHTVDQRLKGAIQVLGVESRVEAARLLARHEGGGTYQPLVYQSPDIASEPHVAPIPVLVDHGDGDIQAGRAMREDQAAFDAALRPSQRPVPLPLPIGGAQPDDLKPWQRLGWAVAIMFGVALTFGVFVAGVEALSRLAGH
jgi:DNA-binding CsgD family transcriptional regulator